METTALLTLDPVVMHFLKESQEPVEDLALRGVTREAVDRFIEDCMMEGVNSGLDVHQTWMMIARSCFHMGMLTEDYLREKGGDV